MKTPEYGNFEAMLAETRKESDRACALILAANLDNRLRTFLCAFFVKITPSYKNQLFEGNGCLASFSSRIQFSYVLGLIAENEHHDLNIIRRIRNYFAHKEHGWSFHTQEIRDRCSSLQMIARTKEDYPLLKVDLTNPRTEFEVTATSLSLLLMDRARVAEKEKRSLPHPSTILPAENHSNG